MSLVINKFIFKINFSYTNSKYQVMDVIKIL